MSTTRSLTTPVRAGSGDFVDDYPADYVKRTIAVYRDEDGRAVIRTALLSATTMSKYTSPQQHADDGHVLLVLAEMKANGWEIEVAFPRGTEMIYLLSMDCSS